MKHTLLILGLILSVRCIYAQDTMSVDELPAKAALTGVATEYFYLLDNITDKHFTGLSLVTLLSDSTNALRNEHNDSIAALRLLMGNVSAGKYWNYIETKTSPGSYTIYGKYGLKYPGLYIGGNPGTAYNKYKLTVVGLSNFTDTLYAGNGIKLGENTYIYDSLGTIYLTNSTIKYDLSGLTELPTSLTGNWTLTTGTYDLNFIDGSGNGYAWDYSERTVGLIASGKISLSSAVVEVSDSLYAEKIGVPAITTDSIILNGELLTDWNDVGGGSGNTGGVYVPGSSADEDTIRIMAIVSESPTYDGVTDTIDYIVTIRDTTVTQEHKYRVAITAANINDGATVVLVPSPGAGKSIYPTRILIYLTGSTAVTGTDDSNIATGTNTMQAVTVAELGLNQTTQQWGYLNLYDKKGLGNASPENLPINIIFDADYSGTNRAGWIETYYYIVTH